MSDEKRLTANDPVPQETLTAFGHIEDAKARVALELLAMEQRKIQLLAATKKLDDQYNRLFETLLVERGLPLDAQVDIDVRNGAIKVLNQPPQPPQPAETPPSP